MKNLNTVQFKNLSLLAGALLALAVSPSANAALVAYYDFEDDVLDSSGNTNNGTVSGTTTFVTDVSGTISSRSTKAFSFDGATYIALPHAGIDFVTRTQAGGASISMWVKAAAQNQGALFSEGHNVDLAIDPIYNWQTGDLGVSQGDRMRLAYRGDSGTIDLDNVSTASAFDNTWNHVVLTDNNGTVNMYIDGSLDSTHSYTIDPGAPFDYSTLGSLVFRGTDVITQYTGLMDEVAIYDSVLTTGEITSLASGINPSAIPEPNGSLVLLCLGGLSLLIRKRA